MLSETDSVGSTAFYYIQLRAFAQVYGTRGAGFNNPTCN
ncbi:unnamed protein product [Acanthoscelides obtectus]|uniref:Uncharacterized protein n=1 Tax=Acanthoscelides obtectus TaxID=200917 RepID=A0A9P0JNA1_ACAOB|nr:unnamed protein product [Acanthoscelides obtectus]CAK1662081.1 hypothetical protein AOBTE_LOCUS22970 [Acanthoscelides obtectus]